MPRRVLVCVTLLASLSGVSPLLAVDYFWQNPVGGAFDEFSNWLPNSPPGIQGPGGPLDTVNFDLGVAPSSRYIVSDFAGESDQLLVHNDSVQFSIFLDYALLSAGGTDPSFIVGAANGDTADVIVSGAAVSVLETEVTRIANVAGSTGSITAAGLQWTGGNLRVGHAGSGTLTIEDDATISASNASLGHLTGSTGRAVVQDGGNWTTSGNLLVGREGDGSMTITTGGSVRSSDASIGSEASGEGTVSVSNPHSTWTIDNTLTIGGVGDGSLTIGTGGSVSNMNAVVGNLPASDGVVSVLDGDWATTGRLTIGGATVGGVSGGSGLMRIDGDVTVGEEIVISPNGTLELQGGLLTAEVVTLEGTGRFNWTNGIYFARQFNGDLVNEGGSLVPEDQAVVNGNYTHEAGSRLSISVLGEAANNVYTSLGVTGTASLGGDLVLSGATLYEPGADEVYTVLQASDLIGSFNNVVSGERIKNRLGTFVVYYGPGSPFTPDHVVLTDFQPFSPADFDNDGDVDGDDLAQWKGDFGVNGLSSADDDGDSDGHDFLAWQQQLGGGVPAAIASATVPEPASWVIALLLPMAIGRGGSVFKLIAVCTRIRRKVNFP
jgi:T5SS/PEP-CTERM-associated repeat protein